MFPILFSNFQRAVSNAFRLVRRFRLGSSPAFGSFFCMVSNAFRLVRRFRQLPPRKQTLKSVDSSPMPFGWLGVFAALSEPSEEELADDRLQCLSAG